MEQDLDYICHTQILKLETIKMVNFDTTIFYYEIPVKTFPYYDIYDGLTFSLHPANESFSILHQLKKHVNYFKQKIENYDIIF